jgi:hypothetical protein
MPDEPVSTELQPVLAAIEPATAPEPDKVSPWVDNLRAVVRPGAALVGILALNALPIIGLAVGKLDFAGALAAAAGVNGPIVGYYFGARTASKGGAS